MWFFLVLAPASHLILFGRRPRVKIVVRMTCLIWLLFVLSAHLLLSPVKHPRSKLRKLKLFALMLFNLYIRSAPTMLEGLRTISRNQRQMATRCVDGVLVRVQVSLLLCGPLSSTHFSVSPFPSVYMPHTEPSHYASNESA